MFESKPLLLLDDIFSELDVKNKKLVIISVAKLLAEAITCIYNGDSMSEKLIPKAHRTYDERS